MIPDILRRLWPHQRRARHGVARGSAAESPAAWPRYTLATTRTALPATFETGTLAASASAAAHGSLPDHDPAPARRFGTITHLPLSGVIRI